MMKICLTLQSSNYIFLFTNIWIPEEEIFETVPRTVVKLLYRQLRGKLRFRRQSKEKWSYREIAKLTPAVR